MCTFKTNSDSEGGNNSFPLGTKQKLRDYVKKKSLKKASKFATQLQKTWTRNVLGYSNENNPFGDSNMEEPFVWKKKIENNLNQGRLAPLEISLKLEKKRQRECMAEIEKVKKRREDRAIAKAQREEETAFLARERARAEDHDWQKKEEEFHFKQSQIRTEIRWREDRAKPIDVLLKHILNSSEDLAMTEPSEPYEIFKGLTVKEMEELHEEIQMHLQFDRATATHIEFWESMMVVCHWEIAHARTREEVSPRDLVAEDRGLHEVAAEVDHLLQGQSVTQFETWQEQTEAKLRSGTAQVVEYWEAVLKRLHFYKAKARLREIHVDLNHRKQLKRTEIVDGGEKRSPSEDREGQRNEKEDTGSSSPQPANQGDVDELVLDPDAYKAELARKRAEVANEQQESRLQGLMGGVEDGDTMLSAESEVDFESTGVCWWHDKFRPTKPKYFIRVHTGYIWNKYNRTHHDHDNPPPKMVQGYKFDIFYPDLVYTTKAPTYFVEREPLLHFD